MRSGKRSAATHGGGPFFDAISPELVLVSSPEDARWARDQLPEPGVTITRRPREEARLQVLDARSVITAVERDATRRPRPQVLDPQSLFAVVETAATERSQGRTLRLSRRVAWAAPAIVVAAAVVIVALPVAGLTPKVRPFLVASPAPAATVEAVNVASEGGSPVAVQPPPAASTPLRPALSATARPQGRTGRQTPVTTRPPLLSWSAVAGTRRYWVELAIVERHEEKILLAFKTREPRLQVPETWSNAGRRRRLVRGLYRWYVWPGDVTASGRSGVPVARGEFVVP